MQVIYLNTRLNRTKTVVLIRLNESTYQTLQSVPMKIQVKRVHSFSIVKELITKPTF